MSIQNAPAQEENTGPVRRLDEFTTSVAALRTQTDRARNIFGFGRRIIVPPDEIHVVVGDGRHIFLLSNSRKVYGQTADRPSRYWLNPLSQVIKLKTVSFTVPIRGPGDVGVAALDNSKVSFRLWAHAVAKLNPDKAEVAAQRVGLDTSGLINTITEVGTAELVAAAASMPLQEIIANRQRLAEIAFPKVNNILSELGYDLALLTITKLEGVAYKKLVEQAEAGISKETSIATNREQVLELQDDQGRARTEAEIRAQTEIKVAAEQLEAQREVQNATLGQQEALVVRRHELELLQLERSKQRAETSHGTDLAKVLLDKKLGEAETEKSARLARLAEEREAEIRLVQTEKEAERLALEQIRQIERAAERTEAEARRLRAEEFAAAERTREVALVEARQRAEALEVDADAEANALKIRTQAQTRAERVTAEAEADATQKRAEAAKKRAEALRAETAAPGLAEAEVEAARLQVTEKQVEINRNEGLALAEVSRAQAEAEADRLGRLKDVEIRAQERLLKLYNQAPVLVDLEKIRLEHQHRERLANMRLETSLKAFEALAPGVRMNIFGSGGQAGAMMADLLAIAHGFQMMGEEVPALGRLANGRGNGSDRGLAAAFQKLLPAIRTALSQVNPRMFSSMRIADLVDRLGPVVAGEGPLVDALAGLKADAQFRMVGDLPLAPFLHVLGFDPQETSEQVDDSVLASASLPD